jgi:PAS domain S-box-containing protein
VIGASRIVRDIGERRQAAAALAESERRFRYMCDHAPVLIWLAGTDALRYWFNRPWLEFTGRSLEEEQGYGWTEGVHPEDYDRCLEIYTASFDRREPFQLDYRLRRCDGQYRWMLATGAPLYGPGGETTGYAGSCIDITERKEIDLKKDNFLAMLGHELRNPIGSVANVVHLIRRRRGDPGTLPGYLDIVDRQVKYMSRLVGDIQDISRLRTGKLTLQKEIIPVQRLLRDALETVDGLIRSRGHQVEVRMPEVEIHLLADPDRMRQVISNLLSNAAKYTPAPGRIWVNLGSSDTEVTLTVRDDGIGIPAEALPTIFDLFEQVPRGVGESREGLGLGLTLVRGLVEMHDGAVTAASEGPGKGSEFTLRLPLAPCREAVPDD